MMRIIGRAVLFTVSATALHAQTPASPARPPLFVRKDAIWAAAFLAGSAVLSTADVRITNWMLARHSGGRDTVARDFARVQEGTLTLGNLALYGIGRLTKQHTLADV